MVEDSVGKSAQPATLVGLDGTVVAVHEGCTVILGTRRGAGRFPVCGPGVEATHCSVEFANGKLVLKTLSNHGTTCLNGVAVSKASAEQFDVITIGSKDFEVMIADSNQFL